MTWLLVVAMALGTEPPAEHWSVAAGRIPVRETPSATAARIGWLNEFSVFAWTTELDGPDCGAGWASLVGGGYACLTSTQPATEPPVALPELIHFDPPRPDEWESYLETLTWDRDPDTPEALLPYVYGKRWRGWQGGLWESLDAWNAGEEPIGKLAGGGGRKNHFVAVEETVRGAVLVRTDGRVAPVEQTHVYPIDRFGGRDLQTDPVVEGWLPGWVIAYEGADLTSGPGGEVIARLDYHAPLDVRDAGGGLWEVRDAEGTTGFVDDHRAMHHWVPREAPEEALDQLWIDVDLGQQVLAIRQGQQLRFVTLVSGGLTGRTPTGLFQVLDKSIHDDMASRAGAADSYHVEEVPWVVHFKPRYALHGTFWHWGFGHRASHGCVNLSPRDAKTVFDAVSPGLPDGWHTVVAREDRPGSLVRVRDGDKPVADRR